MELICILVLVFWNLALFQAGGQALKPETLTNTADGHGYVPRFEISSSGRQWIRQIMCDETKGDLCPFRSAMRPLAWQHMN